MVIVVKQVSINYLNYMKFFRTIIARRAGKENQTMEKKKANEPVMEVVVFETADVITTSAGGNGNINDGEWD